MRSSLSGQPILFLVLWCHKGGCYLTDIPLREATPPPLKPGFGCGQRLPLFFCCCFFQGGLCQVFRLHATNRGLITLTQTDHVMLLHWSPGWTIKAWKRVLLYKFITTCTGHQHQPKLPLISQNALWQLAAWLYECHYSYFVFASLKVAGLNSHH